MAGPEQQYGREARAAGRAEMDEVILAPGNYVYLQDTGRGQIITFVGPVQVAQQGTQQPIAFDPTSNSWIAELPLKNAVRRSIFARESEYVVLANPARKKPADGAESPSHPPVGRRSDDSVTLDDGRTEIIPGPCQFAMWPGQSAVVVPGHVLRTDQFVQFRVTDALAAKANWEKAVVQVADGGVEAAEEEDFDFSTGALNNVLGLAVKYFVPCTGMEVVRGQDGEYVQQAMTLELLEYCILIDQDGTKRIELGPQVVFPRPTETFFEDDEGNRKFRAIELNEIQGLHLKAIADFEEGEIQRKAGDEWFVTGRQCPIYYPRPEVAIIKYGDQMVHYATVVEEGAGRYQLNRSTGEIDTVIGPQMLLCDPTQFVQVRRVLTERQARIWFPNNASVRTYNETLRASCAGKYVTDEELRRPSTSAASASATMMKLSASDYLGESEVSRFTAKSPARAVGGGLAMPAPATQSAGEAVRRETKFTTPKQIVLDQNLDGAVRVKVWQGYAVCVVNAKGEQRIEIGPKTVILDYDEDLAELALSTGKPKNTDAPLCETVYLNITGNPVGDTIQAACTSDHIPFDITLYFRVKFVDDTYKTMVHGEEVHGDKNLWWCDRNYVKTLTDHGRSLIGALLRRTDVKTFDANAEGLLRDLLLGKPNEQGVRPGMFFQENSMLVVEVDIKFITNKNPAVAKKLEEAQIEAITTNLEIQKAERDAVKIDQLETLKQRIATVIAATATLSNKLVIQGIEEAAAKAEKNHVAALAGEQQGLAQTEAEQAVLNVEAAAVLARAKNQLDQEIVALHAREAVKLETLEAETKAMVARLEAAKAGLAEVIIQLGDKQTAEAVARALSVQTLLGGQDLSEILNKALPGLGAVVEGISGRLGARGAGAIPAGRRDRDL